MTEGIDQVHKTKSKPLSDQQRDRIFACICVARYVNGYRDDNEQFGLDVYKSTLEFLKPHLKFLKLDHLPPFNVVRNVWRDFIKYGLIKQKIKPKYLYSDSVDDNSQLSDYSSEPNCVTDDVLRRKKHRSSKSKDQPSLSAPIFQRYATIVYASIASILVSLVMILANGGDRLTLRRSTININSTHLIEKLGTDYSKSLDSRKLRIIRTRAKMMQNEVSILLLLGQQHDTTCLLDPTFCIGQTIANITDLPFGYIDASDPNLDSSSIANELSSCLVDGQKNAIIFDKLEQVKGSQVMNLFQFIDKDETHERRGLLIFVVYAGNYLDKKLQHKMRESDIVERILLQKWSAHVPHDTLTSVISRISCSIVRTH